MFLTQKNELIRARWGITVTFILNGIALGSFVSRIPDFKSILHISNTTLGNSLFFLSIGVLSALAPAGRNAAKRGSAPVIFLGALATAITIPILGLLINLPLFWLSLFLFGFAIAIQDVSMNAHAVTLEQKSDRRLLSVFHAMWSLGTLAGGAVGGLLAQLSIKPIWHFLGIAILFLILNYATRSLLLSASSDKHRWTEGRKSKRPRIFWILGSLGLCAAIGEGSASDWGGVLARNTFHASPFLATLPYVAFTTAMVLGRFSGDYLAHRFTTMKVLSICPILGGVGLAAGLLIGNIYGEIFGWLFIGAGVSVVIPLMFSAAGSIAIKHFDGLISPAEAVAMVSGISYFGFVFGPPMMGFIADQISLRWAMLIPAALAIILSLGSKATIKE